MLDCCGQRDPRGQVGVAQDDRGVDPQRRDPRCRGGTGPAGTASRPCRACRPRSAPARASRSTRSCSSGSSCSASGTGLATTRAVSSVPSAVAGGHDRRDLLGGVDPVLERVAGVGEIEAGEPVGAVADQPDAVRLEPLQGRRHVEDRLHAGADDGRRDPGQRGQVGRLVVRRARRRGARRRGRRWRRPRCRPGRRGAPSRRPSSRRTRRGPRPRPRSRGLTLTTSSRPAIASSASSSRPIRARPATTATVAGTAPADADRLLDLAGDPEVVRPGQPVADDRGLEGDDRPARRQRVGHLRGSTCTAVGAGTPQTLGRAVARATAAPLGSSGVGSSTPGRALPGGLGSRRRAPRRRRRARAADPARRTPRRCSASTPASRPSRSTCASSRPSRP